MSANQHCSDPELTGRPNQPSKSRAEALLSVATARPELEWDAVGRVGSGVQAVLGVDETKPVVGGVLERIGGRADAGAKSDWRAVAGGALGSETLVTELDLVTGGGGGGGRGRGRG